MADIAVVKVTRKGQMTIPQEMRESMGIEPGDYVALRPLVGGLFLSKATVTPAISAEDVLNSLVTHLGKAAEEQGIRDEEDLDALAGEVKSQTYRERYGE